MKKTDNFWGNAERVIKNRARKHQVRMLNIEDVPHAWEYYSISHALLDLTIRDSSRWRKKIPKGAVNYAAPRESCRPDCILAYDKKTDTYIIAGSKRYWCSDRGEYISSNMQARLYGRNEQDLEAIVELIKKEVNMVCGTGGIM